MLEKSQLFNESKLVESKEWLSILKLQDPLRDFLMDRLSKKMKVWRTSHYPEYKRLPDMMADDLMTYPNISEDERTEIMFMITDLNDAESISQDDLRKVLSECPQRAKHYSYGLMKGSSSVRNRIEQFVANIKYEISRESKIRRSVLTKIMSQNENLKHIDELFSADRGP